MSAPINGLRAGDWVKATSTVGCTVVGQAQHDLAGWGGSAILHIAIAGDHNLDASTVRININHWNVEVLMGNLVGEGVRT